jgi:hypothetical protein
MIKKDTCFLLATVAVIIVSGCIVFQRYRLFPCYSPEIETVLRMAGENHRQLVKALKHYGKTPDDRQKFFAAQFLILNMPGKYSVTMRRGTMLLPFICGGPVH